MCEVRPASLTLTPSAVCTASPAHMDAGEGDDGNWELWESSAFHNMVPSSLAKSGLLANGDQTGNSRTKACADAGVTRPHRQGAHSCLKDGCSDLISQ